LRASFPLTLIAPKPRHAYCCAQLETSRFCCCAMVIALATGGFHRGAMADNLSQSERFYLGAVVLWVS